MNNKIIITCLGLLQDRQSLVMYFLTNAKKIVPLTQRDTIHK
jgi:hypothetical protein